MSKKKMLDIFDKGELPSNLFDFRELDIAKHCTVKLMTSPMFCLAERSKTKDEQLEVRMLRESLLMQPRGFQKYIGHFDSIGAQLRNLGHPTSWIANDKGRKTYRYVPFHSFESSLGKFKAEPLVFPRTLNGDLVINPDIWLFLQLTEKREPEHVWYDDEKHRDVIQIRNDGTSQSVWIATDYLQKYLQARRLQLVISEFRQAIYYPKDLDRFKDFVVGTESIVRKDKSAKVVIESSGPNRDFVRPYFIRRMQMWASTAPPSFDKDDPFSEKPNFDRSSFLLPTRKGPVAPARFLGSDITKHKFQGVSCDFLDRVYFSQEALVKYQNLPGHEIDDDGAVRHKGYWSFDRSASRLGDDYLAIAIGDFAEGVTYDQWSHWKQFAVEPPDNAYFELLKKTKDRIGQVNSLVSELNGLNEAFKNYCLIHKASSCERELWKGAANGPAIKELKWYIASHANDSEFRKRATLLSTLIVDEMDTGVLRTLLQRLDVLLPDEKLGSLKLLQRLALTAKLNTSFRSSENMKELISLTKTGISGSGVSDISQEVKKIEAEVFKTITPLFALYDLRIAAGYAHPPNPEKVLAAVKLLHLPARNWGRSEYLALLSKLSVSVSQISEILWLGAQSLISSRKSK